MELHLDDCKVTVILTSECGGHIFLFPFSNPFLIVNSLNSFMSLQIFSFVSGFFPDYILISQLGRSSRCVCMCVCVVSQCVYMYIFMAKIY